MPDVRVPSLQPWGLDRVPGYRFDPLTGREDLTWRPDYFHWHRQMEEWRADTQHRMTIDGKFCDDIIALCRQDSAFFSCLFLDVEEPRSMEYYSEDGMDRAEALRGLDDADFDIFIDELGYNTIHPLLLFAFQAQAHRDLTYVVLGPLRSTYFDLLWDKARGVGMSYAFLAWAYWAWLFVPGIRGSILSEKWDKAERSKDINSLFGKLDLFFDCTPDLLIPEGFREKGARDADRQRGLLVNRVTGAVLATEPTTKDSTRSGREAFVAVDEMNFQEHLSDTWVTIAGTTKHRIGWSSASYRYGKQGERIFKTGREHPDVCRVYTLEWPENPHQDAEWERQERARFKAAGQEEMFDVEYLRNAAAASGRLVYKAQVDLAPWTKLGYDQTRPLKLSVDPGTVDATAFVMWQTHQVDGHKVIRFVEGCELAKVPVHFWAHVMTGIEPRPAWTDEKGLHHPPDEAYKYWVEGFFNQGNILSVMRFMYTVSPQSIYLYGDPTIKRADVTNESWILVFERLTRELRAREWGIDSPSAIPISCNMPYEILAKRNNFQDRRVGMREALMYSEFYSGSPGVAAFREALESTMFQKMTEQSTRPPGHLHDLYSNYTQAGEFGMVWETLKLTPEELQPQKLPKIGRARSFRSAGKLSARSQRAVQRDAQRHTLVGLG
jgi:hypothetical protein